MTLTTEPTREEWLAQRRLGIGASDTPSILGESSWGSAYSVWAEKCGLIEAEDLSEREDIQAGNVFESAIFDWWMERTGNTAMMWPRHKSVAHVDHPWMRCTPDAYMEGSINIQIKTANAFKMADWENGPPLVYDIQVQHEMAVLGPGSQRTILVVCFGGNRLRWYEVDRNDRFIDAMIPRLEAFWELVQTKTPPPIDGSEATLGTIKRLHPDDDGSVVDLSRGERIGCHSSDEYTDDVGAAFQVFLETSPDSEDCEAVAADVHYQSCKALGKAVDKSESAAKAKILAAIGGSTFATINDNYSLKTQTRQKPLCPHCGERTGPASTFRVLRAGVKIPEGGTWSGGILSWFMRLPTDPPVLIK